MSTDETNQCPRLASSLIACLAIACLGAGGCADDSGSASGDTGTSGGPTTGANTTATTVTPGDTAEASGSTTRESATTGDTQADTATTGVVCDPQLPAGWDDEIALPTVKDENPADDIVEVSITAGMAQVDFSDGVTTDVWAYNGSVPGPLIEANVGDTLIVHLTNDLDEPTTIHWHGLELPANMDGSIIAQLAVQPGETFTYEFPLLTAATYWYHPHIRTNVQVERGLYGTLVVHDPQENEDLGLPSDEAVLVLDDVLLDKEGQVAPEFPADPIGRATALINGREGDTLLVNGRVVPSIQVVSGVPIRFRVVNPANARFARISVPGHTMWRIAGDAGLSSAPVELPPIDMIMGEGGAMVSNPDEGLGLMLTPSERAEVVLTPIGNPGDEIFVEWHDFPRGRHLVSDMGGGNLMLGEAPDDGQRPPVQVMRLQFAESCADDTAQSYEPPAALRDIDAIDAAGAAVLPLTFGHSMPNPAGDITFFAMTVNGMPAPFGTLTADDALQVSLGETRVWQITNLTGGDHNFHPHGFFFQHIETEYIDEQNPANNMVVPAVVLENLDTIRIPRRPGGAGTSRTVTRLAVTFTDEGREGQVFASGLAPTETESGGWLAHCHFLEHADSGMMTFFAIEP